MIVFALALMLHVSASTDCPKDSVCTYHYICYGQTMPDGSCNGGGSSASDEAVHMIQPSDGDGPSPRDHMGFYHGTIRPVPKHPTKHPIKLKHHKRLRD